MLEPREGRRLLGRMFVLVGQCTFELTDSRAAGLELRLGGAPSAPLGVQALGQLALPKLQRGHPAVELGALAGEALAHLGLGRSPLHPLAFERLLDGADGAACRSDRMLGRGERLRAFGRLGLVAGGVVGLGRPDLAAQDPELAPHRSRSRHGGGELGPRGGRLLLRPRDDGDAFLQLTAASLQVGRDARVIRQMFVVEL